MNELTKVVVLNLSKDESAVIDIFKENLSFNDTYRDVEFLFKPIPCINTKNYTRIEAKDLDVKWVGISDPNDEILLNNLFLGIKDSYPVTYFNKSWVTEGHIFSIFQGRAYSIFPDINELLDHFKISKNHFFIDWIIKNEIKDGMQPKKDQKKHIFLTPRGYYQKRYISLYETLHNKYVAKVFAKMLIDKYMEIGIASHNILSDLQFDKIIVVTVSSQLIGLAIRDIIINNEYFNDHSLIAKKREKFSPKLIRLASYFSFDKEKPFEDIRPGDRVIIVNDVISTGSLIERLIKGIYEKKAELQSIMTIVDNRFSPNYLSKEIECESVKFSKETENKIISLCSSVDEKRLIIEKFKNKPSGDFIIKRINPILNTVVELSYLHSEKDRVLIESLEDFINMDFSKNDNYQVGHFVQNLSHNAYYIDMHSLFEEENGEEVLFSLKELIENKIINLNLSKYETNKVFIGNALSNIHKIDPLPEISFQKLKTIKQLIIEVNDCIDSASANETSNNLRFSPDFIFHPVFSGIEEVSDETFHKVFGTDVDNIVGLQRYDTSVGWRFPFPAKRFNKLTKGKHVLIIDSGSLTGDSLIQLVDSISFLEVGRIDFLSIIGRIGDFQREFYSRLKSIKVKSLGVNNVERRKIDSTVSLNIFFGTNIHIPPFGSKTSCPFCNEIELLTEFKTKLNGKLPSAINYIDRRLANEIYLIEKREDIRSLPHFPKNKETGKDEFHLTFIMRDKIGKVASYRFYNEHFVYFDQIAQQVGDDYFNKKFIKELEQILICVLNEPTLVNVIKDLLVTIYDILCNILNDIIIMKKHSVHDLYYHWPNYSLLRLFYVFSQNDIYEQSIIESLCEFSLGDKHSQEYLSFLLIYPFLRNRDKGLRNRALGVVTVVTSNFDSKQSNLPIYKDEDTRRLFKDILHTFEPTDTEDVNQAFFNLKLFFDVINNEHTKLFNANISLLNTIIKNENIDELPDIKHLASAITNTVRECVYNNLKTIRHSKLSTMNDWPIHKAFIGRPSSLIECIEELEESYERLLKLRNEDGRDLIQSTIFDFQKNLVDKLQIKYLLRTTDFFTYCNKYYVNLNRCINNALKDNVLETFIKERKNFKIEEFNFEDIIVQGHSDYFYFAFQEIFVNAAKRPENDNSSVSFFIKKTAKTDEVTLLIKQNSPFLHEPNEKHGGLSKIVAPVFKSFCGDENIKFNKELSHEYTIEIRFNTKILKTSKDGE